VSLAEPCAGKAAKLPFSENRTPPRIAAAPRPGAAGQNAVVSDPSLGVCALCAGSPPDAGPLPAGGALLSRRRRARVDHHRPLVPPALGAQPALATPCSLLFGRPPLSTTLSHDLAGLFCSLLDDPLAPVRFFVLKLCSGSCGDAKHCIQRIVSFRPPKWSQRRHVPVCLLPLSPPRSSA